jgi:Ca2+-binding RTX toxin-like protein
MLTGRLFIKMTKLSVLACFIGLAPMTVKAANFSQFDNFADYEAVLGGLPLNTQNFEDFAPGDNLDNIEFLPGISVTSNLPRVEVFVSGADQQLFGFGGSVREQGNAFYDINFIQPYNAVGFNIEAFDPDTPGPAIIDVFFLDGTDASINIFPTNVTESDPIFFGIIADTPIARIRLSEGPEIGGFGNEEVALDDFAVANADLIPTFGCMVNDVLGFCQGTSGSDVIVGTPEPEVIIGLGGDDTIFGGGGDDTIFSGGGNDDIFGGNGSDTIEGGNGDDTIFGDDGDDIIQGGNGDDTIFGDDGDDIIQGGNGNNFLIGGNGNDIIFAGLAANSIISLFATVDRATISTRAAHCTITPTEGISRIDGSPDNDIICGSPNSDEIDGGPGRDRIRSLGGADTIDGGPDGDRVDAGGVPLIDFDSCSRGQNDIFIRNCEQVANE